jgi:hypothetical protein
LGYDKDITENDGSVELGKSVDWLEGDIPGDGGSLTTFKEGMLFSDLQEFC